MRRLFVHLIPIAVFLSHSTSSLCFSLADERPEVSDREIPCRKKGRPKKKKDAKKKDKEGKPVKTKKRKKIVSILLVLWVFFVHTFWTCSHLVAPSGQ